MKEEKKEEGEDVSEVCKCIDLVSGERNEEGPHLEGDDGFREERGQIECVAM